MRFSLKEVLILALLSATVLIWGVTIYISYKNTRDVVVKLLDAELEQSAHTFSFFVGHLLHKGALNELWDIDNKEKTVPSRAFKSKYKKKIAFQLIHKDQGLILKSETAPEEPMSSLVNGSSKTQVGQRAWHVFSLSSKKGLYVIHVGQREDVRLRLIDEIAINLMQPSLYSLPFLAIVIWLIVGRSLKPLNRLAQQLSKREANYLKPLTIRYLPTEIVPLVEQINALFNQLDLAFENERRFTADASHELKTPLAGLLTQAQVAVKTTDGEVRNRALKRIEQAVKRMTSLVQQLLTFSRIESDPSYLTKQPVELSHEVIQIIAELDPEAHKKNISMSFENEAESTINVNAPLIGILIRNIIDNAIKYTPQDGEILITLAYYSGVLLTVEDSGPGIADNLKEDSLKRFYRVVDTAGKVHGSGLGLSMVKRIAVLHDAELTMDKSQFGGLKISICFPQQRRKETTTETKRTGFFRRRKQDNE